ncbi:TPA: helix-turn-helix transcriptional regulator [Stenotrophomonas maltophilia]|nr:helix-turn-helix transcriptional regulator [Stenotrophomonas maltophilia]
MATKTIYQSVYLRLVGQLRERRESLGISQTKLASHLGWPQQRISAVESGARRLDVLEFCLVASALGFSSAEISDHVLKMVQSLRMSQIKEKQ